jgi:predicted TIM-barrel fold metal-dependent hydrolase
MSIDVASLETKVRPALHAKILEDNAARLLGLA